MIDDELRQIQLELKKFLKPEVHKTRKIPGITTHNWIFVDWIEIRERLDLIVPSWQIKYTDPVYIGNDVNCRCTITIRGIAKEAVASVPFSVLSSSGNEATRGSAPDRVAAEGLKNAAELWGVCRYLDNQIATAEYLWQNKEKIDQEVAGELQKIFNYYKKKHPYLTSKAKAFVAQHVDFEEYASQDQVREIWKAIASICTSQEDAIAFLNNIYKEFSIIDKYHVPIGKVDEIIARVNVEF
jgi:hypothetical protein